VCADQDLRPARKGYAKQPHCYVREVTARRRQRVSGAMPAKPSGARGTRDCAIMTGRSAWGERAQAEAVTGAQILLVLQERRSVRRLRRGLPKFLKCNSNLIFIIERLGRRPGAPLLCEATCACSNFGMRREAAAASRIRCHVYEGSSDHGRSFRGQFRRHFRDHFWHHLAAHSAPAVGRVRRRPCRMRAPISRTVLPVGPRSFRGPIRAGRFGRANLPAQSGSSGTSVRSGLRLQTIGRENHRPRRILTPES
jgi:hypothetical protein